MTKPKSLSIAVTLLLLAALVSASNAAAEGARTGLHTCAHLIIPSLFPFFVLSHLISSMGLPVYFGQKLQTPMSLLFGVSGTGAGVFILGLLGGYPTGAAVIVELWQREELTTRESKKLLTFCNNSGPAFLIGAVGVGIFHSSAIGLLLYGVHIIAAVITGLFLSGTRLPPAPAEHTFLSSLSLSEALPEAISKSAIQIIQICGYIVFFGALTAILEDLGTFSALYGSLAAYSALTLQQARALCMGLLELGCGIGAMSGAVLSPQALSLCAFLTGFGGLSVCMQTAGVLQGTELSVKSHLVGRICCSGIAAFLMYTISSMVL